LHFITCFDEAWHQKQRVFARLAPRPDTRLPDGASRTFGYFPTRKEAVAAVLRNELDLHEGIYVLCVVEELGPGIHPVPPLAGANEVWFRWDASQASASEGIWEKGRWIQLDEKPEAFRRTICFALG
jgi:hypothetical protein